VTTGPDASGRTADDLVATGRDMLTLACRTAARLFLMAVRAYGPRGPRRRPAKSKTYHAPDLPSTLGDRHLRLSGPLQSEVGNDTLPVSRVTVVPSVLTGGNDAFHLEADCTDHLLVGYRGAVDVVGETGGVMSTVAVTIFAE